MWGKEKKEMNSIQRQSYKYFGATTNDFWKWGDDGNVIEWTDGTTICYRKDLGLVLEGLVPFGFPSLSTVLLLMSACQNRWGKNKNQIEKNLEQFTRLGTNPDFFRAYIIDAIDFMDRINKLPESLRTGTKRVHLFQEIFKLENNVEVDNPRGVLDDFLSGRLDAVFFNKIRPTLYSPNIVKTSLILLAAAGRKFSNVESLELVLKTGLKNLPAPIKIKEEEEEEQEEKSLLDQLREDQKTEGIAKLCQRVIAGLNIPMHSLGVSDQSFGGVSDITNRGDIDKLLLSELAYDDTTLMVRLANNEAMYLRREELPSELHKERVILMDSTIKMWGVPRVFATSVGLACAIQDKNVASIQSYLLSGEKSHSVDLATKEGVIESLEELHPELNCADALHLFIEENKIDEQTELILITDEQSLENEDFTKTLNEVRLSLTYLITINRQGRLHFYEYSLSGRRLINTTLYDLEELLFKSDKKVVISKSKIDESVAKNLPLIYRRKPFPIYFPSPSIRFVQKNTYQFSDGAVAAITNDSRILFWKKRGLGARELLASNAFNNQFEIAYSDNWVYILELTQKFGNDKNRYINKVLKKWYAINLADHDQSFEVDYYKEEIFVQAVKDYFGNFHLMNANREILFIDPNTGKLEPYNGEPLRFSFRDKVNFSHVKKWVNNGYTTLKKAKRIALIYDGIGDPDRLRLNDWDLKFTKHGFCFEQNLQKHAYVDTYDFADEPSLKRGKTKFRKAVFSNHVYAITDSNGLLHLISTNPHRPIPQVTIPIIVGGAYTAAWASDGTMTGSNYFVDFSNPKRISSMDFFNKYILPFFNEISKERIDRDHFEK